MKKGVIISLSIVAILIAIVAYRFLSTKKTETVVYVPTVETTHIEGYSTVYKSNSYGRGGRKRNYISSNGRRDIDTK